MAKNADFQPVNCYILVTTEDKHIHCVHKKTKELYNLQTKLNSFIL